MLLTQRFKRFAFSAPKNMLGADLFWWRQSPDMHTLITIYTATIHPTAADRVVMNFVLFDADGTPVTKWRRPIDGDEAIVIDSDQVDLDVDPRRVPEEGTLAAFVGTEGPPSADLKKRYNRLYSLIDWYSDGGELVGLHNDQSVIGNEGPIEITEIAFHETQEQTNYLVVLNGDQALPGDSLTLEVKNHLGRTLRADYAAPMKRFSVNKVHLAELFDDLVSFCDGRHASLSGEFRCSGIFTRPYVMTQGTHLSGYHSGDRYSWSNLSAKDYERLGHGEVNPMAVLHTPDVRTTVNIFNTHGSLEDDFWVDARLYDEAGTLLADTSRWLLARRHQLSRGDIADLLPADHRPFAGHVALSFTPDDKPEYPMRLQALLEYQTSQSTARVMAWSDEWNSAERLAKAGVPLAAYYRVWFRPPLVTHLSISNCGLSHDYDRTAPFRVLLKNTLGDTLTYEGSVAPHGTVLAPVDSLFTDLDAFLGATGVGIAVVESALDLAIVQFTHHAGSGVYSAEHFMALSRLHDGEWHTACGS